MMMMASFVSQGRRSSFFLLLSQVFLWDLLLLVWSPTSVEATPVRGLVNCLNHHDCIGANRQCHRNVSMTEGVCICKEGFRPAHENPIKCLSLLVHECHSELDCPGHLPCGKTIGYPSPLDGALDDHLPYGYRETKKRCIFAYGSGIEPHTGGGLRPGGDFYDHAYYFGRHNRLHAGFHPEYIKFVEDAMLVLFLLCVLVTLLVVHRASCYRQFRHARRNGPLRFIIPHRDDLPPPYSQYGPATSELAVPVEGDGTDDSDIGNIDNPDGANTRAGTGNKRRSETPPPTYDEALAISQALSASLAVDSSVNPPPHHDVEVGRGTANPLFIALPASPIGRQINTAIAVSHQMALEEQLQEHQLLSLQDHVLHHDTQDEQQQPRSLDSHLVPVTSSSQLVTSSGAQSSATQTTNNG